MTLLPGAGVLYTPRCFLGAPYQPPPPPPPPPPPEDPPPPEPEEDPGAVDEDETVLLNELPREDAKEPME